MLDGSALRRAADAGTCSSAVLARRCGILGRPEVSVPARHQVPRWRLRHRGLVARTIPVIVQSAQDEGTVEPAAPAAARRAIWGER